MHTEIQVKARASWRCHLHSTMPALVCSFLFVLQAIEGKVVRIDTHAHYVPPFYHDLLVAKNIKPGGRSIPTWSVAEHLAFMDSQNIQMSILSVSTPGARLTTLDVEEGRKLARELNEYGQMLVGSYPGKFQFLATLTLPDVEGSVAEAVYSLDHLKAAGVVLLANSQGKYLGNKDFDPLMEVLNAREAIVFVHPNSLKVAPLSEDTTDSEIPSFVVDFLLDTTRAAANLVRRNVTGRYPNIKFILAHSGGFLPFAANRMAGALTFEADTNVTHAENDVELRKFYVDTALSTGTSTLLSTTSYLQHHQIMFGTDFPYAPTIIIDAACAQLDAYPLVEDQRHQIHFRNANNIFHKSLSYWERVWRNVTEMERSMVQQVSTTTFKAI